jgi:hypothetical protein
MSSFKMLLPLALLSMLASCAGMSGQQTRSTPTPPLLSTKAPTPISATKAPDPEPSRDPLCTAVRIVQLSRQDTTGTKEQVEANNAVLTKVCELG